MKGSSRGMPLLVAVRGHGVDEPVSGAQGLGHGALALGGVGDQGDGLHEVTLSMS